MKKLIFFFLFSHLLIFAQTNIAINSTVIQPSVKPLGINLGGVAPVFYDNGQILKNLTSRNPGFAPTLWRSTVQCSSGTTSQCVNANTVSGWTTNGYWPSGSPITVISGAAIGCTTTLSSYVYPGGTFNFATPCSATLANGDWLIIGQVISGNNSLNNWWTNTTGSGTVAIQSSDLPTSIAPTTLQTAILTAPAASTASLQAKFDSTSGRTFVDLNGTYTITFLAKGVVGTTVNVAFDRNGTYYLASTPITITNSWASYSRTFTASETGYPTSAGCSTSFPCIAQLTITAPASTTVEIANVSTTKNGSAQPTVFRDEVVQSLINLKPGILRNWTLGQLSNTLDNMLADQFARNPSNYSAYYQYSYNDIIYSLPEFLQLCQYVQSQNGTTLEPWIIMPITFSPTDASNLIDYLSGGAGTTYGAKRIAEGFTTPWTSVFNKIHIEFGNEAWNGTFGGGQIQSSSIYGARAQLLFATMKANANYNAATTSLVLGGWFAVANYFQATQNSCNNNDEIDTAPYFYDSPSDSSNEYAPMFAATQALYANGATYPGVTVDGVGSNSYTVAGVPNTTVNGGPMYLNINAEANANRVVPISYYEYNLGTIQATISLADTNNIVSGIGGGVAAISEALNGIQNGVINQNLFELTQYSTAGSNGTVLLWGNVVDLGGQTNNVRPTYLTQQMVNSVITPGAAMNQTVQTGTPCYNQGLDNQVAFSNACYIQSFAFSNSTSSKTLILVNTSLTTTLPVTFSGANAPVNGSTVSQVQLSNASITANNETTANVVPVTSSLTSFNPTTGISLPPFSLTTLTYNISGTTPKTYYFSSTGSDSNSCLTTLLACQTITKANSLSLNPGDTVSFNGSSTFTGTLNLSVCGTSGNLITVNSYGTGQAILDGTGSNYVINDTCPGYHKIQNVTIQNSLNYGYYATSSITYTGLVIDSNTVKANGSNAIYLLNSGGTESATITSNSVYNNGGSGIKVADANSTSFIGNLTVSGNITHNNSQIPSTAKFDNVSIGEIYIVNPYSQGNSGTITISGNASYNGAVGASAPVGSIPASSYGMGIWCDTVSNCSITGNTTYGNQANGQYLEKTISSQITQGTSYNNATVSSTGNIVLAAGQSFSANSNTIAQNTTGGTGYSQFQINFEDTNGQMNNNHIINNVFYDVGPASSGGQICILNYGNVNVLGSGNYFSNNSCGASFNNMIFWNGTFYNSYSSWETSGVTVCGASACNTANSTASINAALLLVNPSAYNFNLTASSPARNAGTTDQDIGAYPYVAGGLNPASPTVAVGQSVTLTAPTAITCGSTGGGSFTGCGTTSVTFNAPASIIPSQVIKGCQVTPDDSVFHVNISTFPADTNSATKFSNMSLAPFSFEYAWGSSWTTSSSPTSTNKGYYSNLPITGVLKPSGFRLIRENGNFVDVTGFNALGNSPPDTHIFTVNSYAGSACRFDESYGDYLNGGLQQCNHAGDNTFSCTSANALTYNWSSYVAPNGTGTVAAGLPVGPLLDTPEEFLSSTGFNHPVGITLCTSCFTGLTYVWPGTATAGGISGTPTANTQLGNIFRIKSSQLSGLIATYCTGKPYVLPCTNFLNQLANFGTIAQDTGLNDQFIIDARNLSHPLIVQFLNALSSAGTLFNSTNFEIVNISSLEQSSTSYSSCPNGQTCLNGLQNYVTIPHQAWVSTGGVITPIAIQSVGIGIDFPNEVAIQAGSYTTSAFPTWVIGSANQGFTWSISSCSAGVGNCGSITSAGAYTPPSSVSNTTPPTVTFQCVASADSNISIFVYGTIYNNLNFDNGLTSAAYTQDTLGNYWYADFANYGGYYNDQIFSPTFSASPTMNTQLSTMRVNYGDISTVAIVPNGNYEIDYWLGFDSSCGVFASCGSWPNKNVALYGVLPVTIENQGIGVINNLDYSITSGYRYGTVNLVKSPAVVTNNFLYTSVRSLAPGVAYSGGGTVIQNSNNLPNTAPSFNSKYVITQATQIKSSATSPYWAIDTWGQNSITSGQTFVYPFTVTDWWTGVNNPSWSIQSGPVGATISAGGVLTLASGTYDKSSSVTILATNGTQSATVVIPITGGSTTRVQVK